MMDGLNILEIAPARLADVIFIYGRLTVSVPGNTNDDRVPRGVSFAASGLVLRAFRLWLFNDLTEHRERPRLLRMLTALFQEAMPSE
jgi:hypothetical protein